MPAGHTHLSELVFTGLLQSFGDGVGRIGREAAAAARAASCSSRGRLRRSLSEICSIDCHLERYVLRLDGGLLSLESLDRLLHGLRICCRKLIAKLGGLDSVRLGGIVRRLQRSEESGLISHDMRGLSISVLSVASLPCRLRRAAGRGRSCPGLLEDWASDSARRIAGLRLYLLCLLGQLQLAGLKTREA